MKRTMTTVFVTMAVTMANANEQPQRNPFRVPIDAAEPAVERPGIQAQAASEPIRLRATLLAGPSSSVILDNAILAIGDDHRGYRLLSVTEGEAVLTKDGETIRLYVDEDDE